VSYFTQETKVFVQPFTRQIEGTEVVIGLPTTSLFLALPTDAVEILDDLASGKTVGQAQELYRERYGEIPDLVDLLMALEERGIVRSSEGPSGAPVVAGVPPEHFHLESFPPSLARTLFGRLALTIYFILIAAAMTLTAFDPGLVPNWDVFVFKEHMSLANLGIVAVMLVTLGVHELAHFVAARARGVSSRFGLGSRLWELVAEADLTGLWALPRQERFVPLLAGMIADATLASFLIGLLFAREQAWLTWNWPSVQFTQAVLLILLLRLLWQFFFHVRTDLYYVLTNLLRCKNLLGDTETALRNLASRFFPNLRYTDQSHIPRHERRVIRAYAVIWILGRALAFSVLLFIRLPVLVQYLSLSLPLIAFRRPASPYQYLDALLMTLFILTVNSLGVLLWLRGLYQRGAQRA
jgi:putative peptide zinc metalloprotease protein